MFAWMLDNILLVLSIALPKSTNEFRLRTVGVRLFHSRILIGTKKSLDIQNLLTRIKCFSVSQRVRTKALNGGRNYAPLFYIGALYCIIT